jgi:hypothetical protein
MAYGTVKVDNITFDNGGSDQNVTVSGLYRATTSGVTVTGTISGAVLVGTTTVSGATVTGNVVQGTTVQGVSGTFTSLTGTTTTGTTANFVSGVFTTQVSGTTVTGTTSNFTSGNFATLSGATATFTSGIIASGTAAEPSLAILADLDTGLFSPGANQLAVATNGTGRLFVDANGYLFFKKTTTGIGIDGLEIQDTGGGARVFITQPGNGVEALSINMRHGAGTQYAQYFYYGGTLVGNINVTSTATAYVTSSDYRLKKNVQDLSNAIGRLQQLKPSRFNFLVEPSKLYLKQSVARKMLLMTKATRSTKASTSPSWCPC